MKGILKASFFRLLFTGFNFLVGLLIAEIAGAGIFGEISLMIVNASLIYLVSGLGADQALVWHGASKQFDKNKVFTFSFYAGFIQLMIFLLISSVFYFVSDQTLLSGRDTNDFFVYELMYFAGLVLIDKYVSILYSQDKALLCNILLSLVTVLFLIFLFIVERRWQSFSVDPFRFFCMITFVQGLSVLVAFHFSFSVSFTLLTVVDLKSFFGFSLIVFITNIIQFLAYRADFWLIDLYRNTGEVGVYAQANRFAQLLWILPNILAGLLIPELSHPEKKKSEDDLNRVIRLAGISGLVLIICIILISLLIYMNFLQPDYIAGFTPLLIMLPGYYFFILTILLASYFSAKKKLRINFFGSCICFILMVITDILLIPKFGIEGAAIANTIAYTASAFYILNKYTIESGLGLNVIFNFKKEDWHFLFKPKP